MSEPADVDIDWVEREIAQVSALEFTSGITHASNTALYRLLRIALTSAPALIAEVRDLRAELDRYRMSPTADGGFRFQWRDRAIAAEAELAALRAAHNGLISRLRARWPHIEIAKDGQRIDPGPRTCLRCCIEDEIGPPFHDGLGPKRDAAPPAPPSPPVAPSGQEQEVERLERAITAHSQNARQGWAAAHEAEARIKVLEEALQDYRRGHCGQGVAPGSFVCLRCKAADAALNPAPTPVAETRESIHAPADCPCVTDAPEVKEHCACPCHRSSLERGRPHLCALCQRMAYSTGGKCWCSCHDKPLAEPAPIEFVPRYPRLGPLLGCASLSALASSFSSEMTPYTCAVCRSPSPLQILAGERGEGKA